MKMKLTQKQKNYLMALKEEGERYERTGEMDGERLTHAALERIREITDLSIDAVGGIRTEETALAAFAFFAMSDTLIQNFDESDKYLFGELKRVATVTAAVRKQDVKYEAEE